MVLTLYLALLPRETYAARAVPLEATVFIRLIGQVRVLRGDNEHVWRERLLDLREVEISSGSGFVISPNGWVVTNHHVVSGGKFNATIDGEKIEIAVDVNRVEVVFPPESGAGSGRRFAASVYATDPELDLAFLHIGGIDLPYVALGDSDAVAPGEIVDAVGYPFGGMVELGKPRAGDTGTPSSPSINRGSISAFRMDAAGERRFLQLSAALNPGNSGGPIVDSAGYVLGVAQLVVEGASAIGFGIPVNVVKRVLQRQGLDINLPTPLLSLGPYVDAETKAIRYRLPAGVEDVSPVRVQVASPYATQGLAVRFDRVASTWTLEQVEAALLTAGTFERVQMSVTSRKASPSRDDKGTRTVVGHATGTDAASGAEIRMEYAIVDLGREKIVARYVGPGEVVALNRSTLQISLQELEVRPLLVDEVRSAIQARWAPSASFNGLALPTPERWVVMPGTPSPCATNLPAPAAAQTLSPLGDFTVALRAAWRPDVSGDTSSMARACSSQPGSQGEASYASRVSWLGIDYHVEGVFARVPGKGLWHLELIAPATKATLVAEVFGAWVKTVAQN